MPRSASLASSAIDQAGSTVEHITNTLPGDIAAATPCLPNSTACVCSALTTTETSTSQPAAVSAGVAQARQPSAAKSCARPGCASHTRNSRPFLRNVAAMPAPMAPSPIKPMGG